MRLFNILLVTSVLNAGYWLDKTEEIAGKKRVSKRTLEEYIYVDSTFSATLYLKRDKSIRMVFYPFKKFPSEIKITKDNQEIKKLKLEGDKSKTIKVFLNQGTYTIGASNPVLFKYFEWINVKLRSIPPLGGGFPVTLLFEQNKYVYYRLTPDTPQLFKLSHKGYAVLFIRPDYKSNLKISVFVNEEKKLEKEFVGRKSSKAKYMEIPDTIPGRVYKYRIRLTKDINEIKIYTISGSGSTKIYLEIPIKREPIHDFSLKFKTQYFTNPFFLSDIELEDFVRNLYTSTRDLALNLNFSYEFKKKFNLKMGFGTQVYLKNHEKNYFFHEFKLTLPIQRDLKATLTLRKTYPRFVKYIKRKFDNSFTYEPLIKDNSSITLSLSDLKLLFRYTPSFTYRRINFQKPFQFLSGEEFVTGFGVGILDRKKISLGTDFFYGIYRPIDWLPFQPYYGHDFVKISLKSSLKPQGFFMYSFSLTGTYYNFKSPNPWDRLHYRRRDFKFSIFNSVYLKGLEFFAYYTVRNTSPAYVPKDYESLVLGVSKGLGWDF